MYEKVYPEQGKTPLPGSEELLSKVPGDREKGLTKEAFAQSCVQSIPEGVGGDEESLTNTLRRPHPESSNPSQKKKRQNEGRKLKALEEASQYSISVLQTRFMGVGSWLYTPSGRGIKTSISLNLIPRSEKTLKTCSSLREWGRRKATTRQNTKKTEKDMEYSKPIDLEQRVTMGKKVPCGGVGSCSGCNRRRI